MKRKKPRIAGKPPRDPHARALASKLFRGKAEEKKPELPRKAKHCKPPAAEPEAA